MNWPARAVVWVQGGACPFSLISSSSSNSSSSVTFGTGHGSGTLRIVLCGCKGLIVVYESGGLVG
jgi:hypothetical protein